MYRVKGYFKHHIVVRYFLDQYDAIEFKDVIFETARRTPHYFGGLGRGNGGEHE